MITIFTPIYNRAYIVGNLYHSLLRQTDYNFEWLIIDDGSTDNIFELVNMWIEEDPPFAIRYYKQDNGGKHRAINKGIWLSQGDAFFIVDSDDYLVDDAIENILIYWEMINENEEFAGVSGLKLNSNSDIIGGEPYFDYFVDATNFERKKYGLEGDKAEVYKTKVLRQFPFPEFEGEKFVTERVVWDKIAFLGYKIRWFNKGIMICEYIEDGLTAKGERLFVQNPKGWARAILDEKIYKNRSEKEIVQSELLFYECMRGILAEDEIAQMLDLSEKEIKMIHNKYNTILNSLICTFKNKNRGRLSLYGMGKYGRRLMGYLKIADIKVDYIIDINNSQIDFKPSYNLNNRLPNVDSVCITLKNPPDGLLDIIRKKLPKTDVWFLKDNLPEEW